MKRPRNAGEHLANEFAAADMIRSASPEWLELYRMVRQVHIVEGRAEAGNLPRHNAAALRAREELRYILDLLDQAEKEEDAPPLDFTRAEGGAP